MQKKGGKTFFAYSLKTNAPNFLHLTPKKRRAFDELNAKNPTPIGQF